MTFNGLGVSPSSVGEVQMVSKVFTRFLILSSTSSVCSGLSISSLSCFRVLFSILLSFNKGVCMH